MEDIKQIVRDKYSEIAKQTKEQNAPSCCGTTSCGSVVDYSIFSENYDKLEGYNPDADLGLGCGLPTEYAGIQPGNSVLDLGSGAGNDCFVARALVGESGYVAGIDFTEAMIEKARDNARKLGFTNVDFIQGDIEDIPVRFGVVDVVISNCVLNLVPDKPKQTTNNKQQQTTNNKQQTTNNKQQTTNNKQTNKQTTNNKQQTTETTNNKQQKQQTTNNAQLS